MIHGVAFLVAAVCATVMGFAIQRGATCTVAAIGEVVEEHGTARLLAMIEASLWVAGGLVVAHAFGWLTVAPAGHALDRWTVGGAVLLGLGAFVNRACVMGAVARFGSGQWAYAATPFGFYLGCVLENRLVPPQPTQALEAGSVVLAAPGWIAWVVLAVLAWRIATPLLRHRARLRDLVTNHLWSPHAATTVIGVTFCITLVLVGAWGYTDGLAELARGMPHSLAARGLLLLCLLAGALIGGWTAGLFRHTGVGIADLARCIVGGMLMGWGSLLIPGGNDGLVLVGMPLLWPYAWVAFATMCITVGIALAGQRLFVRAAASRTSIY